jgi:DNA primase
LDLISCFAAGVQNVVAPQGTAFTAEHARILKRYVEEVILCFDSDEAGQNAAVRSLDHLLASGLAVRVAVIPPPDDPDSFIKARGGAEFKKLVDGAAGFYDYYLDQLCASNDVATDRGRLAVLRSMAVAVNKSGNGVIIDKYAQRTALRLGVAPEAVRTEFKKVVVQKPHGDATAETSPEEPEARPSPLEFWLLKLMLVHDEVTDWAAAYLDPSWIEHELVRLVTTRRLEAHRDHSWISLAGFLAQSGPDIQALITEASTTERPMPNPAQQLRDIAIRLRNQFIDRRMRTLLHQLNQPGIDDERRLEMLRQQQELRQLKTRPIEAASAT